MTIIRQFAAPAALVCLCMIGIHLWHPSLPRGRSSARKIRYRLKPVTVSLGHEFDESGRALVRRRKLQPSGIKSGMDSPSIVPALSPSRTPSMEIPVSAAPSLQPSNNIRQGQSSSDAIEINQPTNSIDRAPVLSKSTRETSAPFQPLKFAAVPVGFDVFLQTPYPNPDLLEIAEAAKYILEDHLSLSFRRGFDEGEGVVVRSVDLNVKGFRTHAPSERSRGLQTMRRFMQHSSSITLEARGVAGFQVNRDTVDTGAFLDRVNAIIDESVEPDMLTDLFQNSTLAEYRVESVENTEGSTGDNGPTLVEIIIAIILIVLMAAGLVGYGCVFWKKHKKRQKRRKQFGVGHKSPTPYKGPPKRRTPTARAASIPPVMPKYPTAGLDSSSSESSYKGLGSEDSDDGADIFAKELRLAASLDKKAWHDFQKQTQQYAKDGISRDPEESLSTYTAGNGVYKDLSALEMTEERIGVEQQRAGAVYGLNEEIPSPHGVGLKVTGDTVSIKSNNSFPYGDENDNAGYLHRQLALYRENAADSGSFEVFQDELYNENEKPFKREDSSGGWRMVKSLGSQSDKASSRKPPPYSFLYHSTKPREQPETHVPEYGYSNENASDPSSVAVRGSPMSQSWSTNPRPGSITDNNTNSTLRGSPHSSTWNSSSRGMMSEASLAGSPAFESTAAVYEETITTAISEEESLMTADIVKEVQRLTQFVKTYEKKKEHRMKHDGDIGHGQDHSDSFSSKNLGYDSMMDTIASLEKTLPENDQDTTDMDNVVGNTTGFESSPSLANRNIREPIERSNHQVQTDIPRIQSMPSSDSSGIDTMESDDLSRRLGITPFSVQKPTVYQNPSLPQPTRSNPNDVGATLSGGEESPREASLARDSGGARYGGGGYDGHSTPKSKSNLASLRHSEAILDGSMSEGVGPSDEFTLRGEQHQHMPQPEPNTTDSKSTQSLQHPFQTSERLLDPRLVTPRKRSKNQGFNKIVSMFEAKDQREPIFPPNGSWQYNC